MAIRGLNIYLLKDAALDPTSGINFDAATGLENLSGPGIGPWHLVIRQGEEKYPDWAYLFQDLVDLDLIGKTRSVGALRDQPSALHLSSSASCLWPHQRMKSSGGSGERTLWFVSRPG